MSMAAANIVSVSSQSDSEKADLAREKGELAKDPQAERRELSGILPGARRLPEIRPAIVADQLMAKDALAAHARDELGSPRRRRRGRCRPRWRRRPRSRSGGLSPPDGARLAGVLG